jgi:hypothetical protein
MNKNHLFLGISVISLVLMGLVVSNPFLGNNHVSSGAASDFYQRHPDWIWTTNHQNAIVPMTGHAAYPDYFQRHPELSSLTALGQGASDYFERHPELIPAAKGDVNLTDFYFRHINARSIP